MRRWWARWTRELPLRWRIGLAAFGLMAVLLATLGGVITYTEREALFTNQAVSLHDEARLLMPAVPNHPGVLRVGRDPNAPGPGQPATSGMNRALFLATRLEGANIGVTVYDPAGAPILTSGDTGAPAPSAVLAAPADIAATIATPPGDSGYQLLFGADGGRQLVVLIPLQDASGATVAVLQLNTPTAPLDRSVRTMLLVLISGIVVALGLAALLISPLIAAALRPLATMERATTQIAESNLSLRLEEPATRDEIGRLARSFNLMVERLEAAFDRQKRFVADVSHELRTPLTALDGGMEMLLLGAADDDPAAGRRLLRGMYAEVERMRRLVEDLLTLTRLDEGRATARQDRLDLHQVIVDAAEAAEHLARGQIIVTELPPELPQALADGDYARQVLLSLVDNALKYTPAGGTVTLGATPSAGETVSLFVRDSGAGIPPDALPHVFERFYRADPARARDVRQRGGSGLGLAIAKSLIELQHGAISIESVVERGTTVTITLPASPATDPARAPRPIPA